MKIEWNAIMSTGVTKLDEQHQELIRKLNELGEAMLTGRGRDQIEDILNFLEQYALSHFSYEEDCFIKYKCPMAEKNKAAHQHFIERFVAFRNMFTKQGTTSSLAIEIHKELSTWLIEHIIQTDASLRPCIKQTTASPA